MSYADIRSRAMGLASPAPGNDVEMATPSAPPEIYTPAARDEAPEPSTGGEAFDGRPTFGGYYLQRGADGNVQVDFTNIADAAPPIDYAAILRADATGPGASGVVGSYTASDAVGNSEMGGGASRTYGGDTTAAAAAPKRVTWQDPSSPPPWAPPAASNSYGDSMPPPRPVMPASSSYDGGSGGNVAARRATLAENERQLALVTAEVQRLERQLGSVAHEDNFPPLHCLCIQPVVFHDIEAEIPLERHAVLRLALGSWIALCFMLVFNCALAFATLVIPSRDKTNNNAIAQSFGVSVLFMIAGIPLGFIFPYWMMYRAAGGAGNVHHYLARAGLLIAVIFDAFIAIGILGFGGCGIVYGSTVSDNKGKPGLLVASIICSIAFIMHGIVSTYLLYKFWCVYSDEDSVSLQGATLDGARIAVDTQAGR